MLNDARVASLGFFKDNVFTTRISKEKKFKIKFQVLLKFAPILPDYKGLLYKLQTVGIKISLLQWFTDYLNNWKQMVALPDAFSQWSIASQRSILGSLLFLMYINDIVLDINSSMRLFAGNTNLYILVENLVQASVPFTSIYMGI